MIILPELPYKKDALEPYISAKTIEFHHEKHHAGYVNKLNELINGTQFAKQSLEEIVKNTYNKSENAAIFNNAAQVWNHTFYWNCLKNNADESPEEEIMIKIKESFGDLAKFREQFAVAAVGQFGSGWAWLANNSKTNKLEIIKTANADTPLAHEGLAPLLTIDVWEHAYYLDYQNRRSDYVKLLLEKLINWEFILANYQQATY